MTKKLTVKDVRVAGERVLVRVDFNVPLGRDGSIADDTRVRAALPTISYLVEHDASVILCSHLGRPDGKHVATLSLRPLSDHLAKLLGRPVGFVDDCVDAAAENAARSLRPGELLMLENLRFHPEEEANDPEFARALARLADLYVDDAFGTAHRAHASTEGVTNYLPSVAGLLMERELDYLGKALGSAERPYAAVIGGAKVSGKLEVLRNLATIVDRLIIGGGMANTFLKAQGFDVGESLAEDGLLETALDVIRTAQRANVRLELPCDAVIAAAFAVGAERRTVDLRSEAVPGGWRIMDIGPRTLAAYTASLRDCKTIFWNGPMGVFEMEPFASGTLGLARAIAETGAVSIVGGGDTDAAVEAAGVQDRLTHVSTGGGASLEFVEGKSLPGVEALQDASRA